MQLSCKFNFKASYSHSINSYSSISPINCFSFSFYFFSLISTLSFIFSYCVHASFQSLSVFLCTCSSNCTLLSAIYFQNYLLQKAIFPLISNFCFLLFEHSALSSSNIASLFKQHFAMVFLCYSLSLCLSISQTLLHAHYLTL